MLDRRSVLAAFVATILLGVAILAPFDAPAEEVLEETAVAGPITTAIDEGAAPSLIGLLPTSEAHQRATAVVNGLKAGVPATAPVLNAAQLDDVEALASGAVKGTLTDPTFLTTSDERARLGDFAKGYLSGALAQMATAPSAGRAAVDAALTQGIFAGATSVVLGPDALLSNADLEAYARKVANDLFDELDANGALLAGLAGSPALADITIFATDVSRGQLDTVPIDIVRAQLDAVATFGAGTLDGMIVGIAEGYPQGVPAPSEQDLRRFFQQVAEGHDGAAPWSSPSSLPLLFAYADAVGAAAVGAVDAAREKATGTSPPSTLDEIGAWAIGVAHAGYGQIDSIPSYSAGLERDVRAYAEGLTAPGLAYLLTDPHPSLDPEAVTAYAEGLGGGLADLAGASTEALGLTQAYLDGLSSALTSLPTDASPIQSAALSAYLAGTTNLLTARMDGIATLVTAEDLPIVQAMATGLAEGAIGIVTGPSLTRPDLAGALGEGLANGILGAGTNPHMLAEAGLGFKDAAKSWLAGIPRPSLVAINDLVLSTTRDPYNAIRQYGETMGRAPLTWAESKEDGLTDEGFGGAADLLWLSAFTNTSAPIILGEIKEGLMQPDTQRTLDAVNGYAANVTGNLSSLELTRAIRNLTSSEYKQHAKRFAEFVLTPLDWTGGKPETGSAREVLRETIKSAKDLERFRDAEYASAALAFLKATGEGLKEARPKPGQIGSDLRGDGETIKAWIGGVTDAILEVPTKEVRGDISARVLWLKEATKAAAPAAGEATKDQLRATRQFAKDTATWALGAPGRIPPPGTIGAPLVTWANATVGATLASLPPVMTEEEQAAVLAYAEGIQRAITALPPTPNPLDWGIPDAAAMEAYVGGIVSGIGLVQNDTTLFLCAYKLDTGSCPEDPDEDPPCDPCPPPEPEPCDDFECQFDQYTTNLGSWAENLSAEGLLQMDKPDSQPTKTGIALVARWSAEVLAGHGFCPDFESQTFECDGPRGPVGEFASAREENVGAFADAIAQGYASFIDVDDPPAGFTRPLTDPILAWAAGIQAAAEKGFLDPEDLLPGAGGQPGDPEPPANAPPTDPEDPEFIEKLHAWTDALLAAPGSAYDSIWVPFPDTTGWNATVAELDYVFGHVLLEGGLDALDQVDRNLSTIVLDGIPNASLDALALGLVNATKDVLVDPAAKDLEGLLAWYQGLAQGGVEAILEGADTIKRDQPPAIAAYAEYVATTYGPPAPPTQAAIDDINRTLFPPDEEPGSGGGGSGGGGGDDEDEPSAEEVYLTNVQAHGEGLAKAILETPASTFIANAQAYGTLYLSYVSALANATTDLPPVSPDTGFPGRLSAWSQAQADAALAAPPTSPDRVGPDPDTSQAQALLEAFAGTSPWNLPTEIGEKTSWAYATVAAGIQAACPSTDPAECQVIGDIIGEALGTTLPGQMPDTNVPLPQEIDLLKGIIEGAAAGLPGVDPGAAPIGMVEGIVAALVPEGANDPDADAVAEAVATALGPALPEIPAGWAKPAAETIAQALLSADPARIQALANGAVAFLVSTAQTGASDPAAMQQSLQAFLAPGGSSAPSVSVSDGTRTYANAQLSTSAVLDGLAPLGVQVHAPASTPIQASWEMSWSATDASAPGAQRKPLAGRDGVYTASFTPAELASLPRGASVQFYVYESGAASSERHGPYKFLPDRDAPSATLTAPASASGASFSVGWSGRDGDSGIASFRVEVRDGPGGAWREWLKATTDTSATFSGVAGHTYAIRVTPTDAVGHVGPTTAEASTSVPTSAAANRAPLVAFTAPVEGGVFGRSISVVLAATDPDGTQPTVRVCLRKAGTSVDLECPYEGATTTLSLDTRDIPDGSYRLHASATDGTMSAEALSGAIRVDRSPPSFRGAGAEASPTRVVLSAALDDATRVTAEVAGRTVGLTEDAPGVWTGVTALAPGDYVVSFKAIDATGNEATTTREINVPEPAPPAGSPSTPTTPTAPTNAPTTPTGAPTTPGDEGGNGVPGASLAIVLVALAAVAIALRRRS